MTKVGIPGNRRSSVKRRRCAGRQGRWAKETLCNMMRKFRETVHELAASDEQPAAKRQRAIAFISQIPRDEALHIVTTCGYFLAIFSDEVKADRDIVLAAVRQNGLLLKFAAEELQSDQEVLLEAVRQNGCALQHVSYNNLSRPLSCEVMLAAVQQNGDALEFARWDHMNREIMMAAVEQTGHALCHFAKIDPADGVAYEDKEVADRELVLIAVRTCGFALGVTADELGDDREVVMAAVTNDGDALEWASDRLRADRDIVKAAVQQSGKAFRFAADELLRDAELIQVAKSCNFFCPYDFWREKYLEARSDLESALKARSDLENAHRDLEADLEDERHELEEARQHLEAKEAELTHARAAIARCNEEVNSRWAVGVPIARAEEAGADEADE